MVKTVEDNSSYEPCIRSYRWLKLKRDYLEQSLSDTLDLLVLGAKFGEGKRTGYYGTLLMASYNQEKDRYETTGLVGSGFSDESLKLIYEVLKECIIPEPQDDYFVLPATGGKEVPFPERRSTCGSARRWSARSWPPTCRYPPATPVATARPVPIE
jgi:ATP-dependent DNA ligase